MRLTSKSKRHASPFPEETMATLLMLCSQLAWTRNDWTPADAINCNQIVVDKFGLYERSVLADIGRLQWPSDHAVPLEQASACLEALSVSAYSSFAKSQAVAPCVRQATPRAGRESQIMVSDLRSAAAKCSVTRPNTIALDSASAAPTMPMQRRCTSFECSGDTGARNR